MVDSRKVRRVDGEKIFLSSYKRTYLYWFKFLQECQSDKTRRVDWSKYQGWGGFNLLMDTDFDTWWNRNWINLFGHKKGEEPKFKSSSINHKYEHLRTGLLVYEYGLKYPNKTTIEISQLIQKRETQKRFVIQGFQLEDKVGDIDFGTGKGLHIQKRISFYKKRTKEIMENVCKGIFP